MADALMTAIRASLKRAILRELDIPSDERLRRRRPVRDRRRQPEHPQMK